MNQRSGTAQLFSFRSTGSKERQVDAFDRMVVREANSPRTVGAAGGATQEVVTPMPDKRSAPKTRWTAFDGEYAVAHASSKENVLRIAREKGRAVTHVVLRERAYPFKHIRQEKP